MGNIFEVLSKIQRELSVPKNQYNSFGKYKYRKCEDILEAVKKILPSECAIIVSDDIQVFNNFNYVKATATLLSNDGSSVCAHGFARESIDKKGMDAAQMTGTSSSYARKYALCGLLAIDDNDDPDEGEKSKSLPPAASSALPMPKLPDVENAKDILAKFVIEATEIRNEYNRFDYDEGCQGDDWLEIVNRLTISWNGLCDKYIRAHDWFRVPQQWADGMGKLLGIVK